MEEPKRIQITTVQPEKQSQKQNTPPKCVRLSLELKESTDKTCPEFFYTELVKNTPGEDGENPDDPFGEEDDHDKLAAIARQFEQKYGPKPGGKKKERVQELVDLGEGYDDEDDFIDNSEAYDEIVPETLTTKLGGFYINSGKLDFKEISDDSQDDFQPASTIKKKKKKRKIESDDESEGEEKKKSPKKKKLKEGSDGVIKKKKKKLFIGDGEKPFKKPKKFVDGEKAKQNKTSNVAALLKTTSPKMNGENVENGIASPSVAMETSEEAVSKLSTVESTIDSVAMTASDSDSKDFEDVKKVDPESVPKLPAQIPSSLEKIVEDLKQAAKVSQEGKCKFFTTDVNRMLLDAELGVRQLPCSLRTTVYGHLAAYLPCSKDTLIKRAKTLRVKYQDDKVQGPLEKLKTAVLALMPSMQQKYEAECQKAALERKEEGKEDEKEGKEGAAGDTEDVDKEGGAGDGPKKKPVLEPKRKFEWNSTLRSLLCDVVRAKLEAYELSKVRAQSAEEFLKAFFDKEVRPLWPKKWMQNSTLYKESRAAHTQWTNPQKPKKNIIVTKTPVSGPGKANLPVGKPLSAPAGAGGSKVGAVNSASNQNNSAVTSKSLGGGNTQNSTPSIGKPPVPTLLDYANEESKSKQTASSATPKVSVPKTVSNMTPAGNKTGQNTSAEKKASENLFKAMESVVNVSNPAVAPVKQRPGPQTNWDHIVSDILRNSLTPEGKSSNVSTSPVKKPSPDNSFLAQFQKYAASIVQSKTPANDSLGQSPNLPSSAKQLHISPMEKQQQLLKQQQQQKFREQQKLREQQNKLLIEQQQKALKELEQQKQKALKQQQKLLQEMALKEKQKLAQQQLIAQQKHSQGQGQKVTPKFQTVGGPKLDGQMKGSVSSSQPVYKIVTQASPQTVSSQKQNVQSSGLTEHVIRQNLPSSKSGGSPNVIQVSSDTRRMSTGHNAPVRISVTTSQEKRPGQDAARRGSPGITTKPTSVHTSGQVIKITNVTNSKGSASQGPSVRVSQVQGQSQSASNIASYQTTEGRMAAASTNGQATSLLKTLFSQSQSSSQPTVSAATLAQVQSAQPAKWSSATSIVTTQNASGHHGNSKTVSFPQTTAHQTPGYQSIKLSSLLEDAGLFPSSGSSTGRPGQGNPPQRTTTSGVQPGSHSPTHNQPPFYYRYPYSDSNK